MSGHEAFWNAVSAMEKRNYLQIFMVMSLTPSFISADFRRLKDLMEADYHLKPLDLGHLDDVDPEKVE